MKDSSPRFFKQVRNAVFVSFAGFISASVSLSAQALECGDPSPTMLAGEDLRVSVTPTALTKEQEKSLELILRGFRDKWRGTGQGVTCMGNTDKGRAKIQEYSLEADGSGDKHRAALQVKKSYAGGSSNAQVKLVLAEGRLRMRENIDDVEILRLNHQTVEFVFRFNRTTAITTSVPTEARWLVNFRKGSGGGRSKLFIESQLYGLGGLYSTETWDLSSF